MNNAAYYFTHFIVVQYDHARRELQERERESLHAVRELTYKEI